MKVLHVYRTYFPDTQGGLEEVIRQICIGTSPHGCESRVYTLSDRPHGQPLQRPEAEVVQVKKSFEIASCGVSFSGVGEFSRQVEWADIVNYHYPWPFSDFLYFSAGRSKPAIITYHSDIVRQRLLLPIYRPIMRRYLSSMERIIATSPNYFATSDVLAEFADKVEIIPIGLDQSTYPPGEAGQELAEDTSMDIEGDYFLFVGVLRYYKGLNILLDAIKGAPYRVVIVGSGPVEEELKRQAEKNGLDNVIFTGFVSDAVKVRLFRSCLGVVFPSYLRAEAFGVTLLEGAMHAKPLVSAEVGSGTSHVNIDGETGMVVPPADCKSLREAMDHLYSDRAERERLGQNARARYETLFTGKVMGERYAKVYAQVVAAWEAQRKG